MSSTDPGAQRTTRSPLFSPQPVILALVLTLLLVMFGMALQPDFKGGRFLISALALAIVLVGVMLVRAVTGRGDLARDHSEDDVPLKVGTHEALGWTTILRAAAVIAGIFAAVMLFGMVIGLTIATFAIMRWHMHISIRHAAVLSFIWGVLIPVVFRRTLEVALWPGLVPELWPGWIGGGVLPPV